MLRKDLNRLVQAIEQRFGVEARIPKTAQRSKHRTLVLVLPTGEEREMLVANKISGKGKVWENVLNQAKKIITGSSRLPGGV